MSLFPLHSNEEEPANRTDSATFLWRFVVDSFFRWRGTRTPVASRAANTRYAALKPMNHTVPFILKETASFSSSFE
jgi:hypothetical protein